MGKNKRQGDPILNDENSIDTDDEIINNPEAASQSICKHVRNSVNVNQLRKVIKNDGIKVENCSKCIKNGTSSPELTEGKELYEYDKSLWMCLKCGTQLCGRFKNKHALEHFKTPHSDKHSIALNTTTLEIWCYECDSMVKPDFNKGLADCLEAVRKSINKIPAMDPVILNTPSPLTGPTEISNCLDFINKKPTVIEMLPRVRGLTNLGNTCFFNAVLQCLAQTPYLLPVLKEAIEKSEKFTLPGGLLKLNDGNESSLPPICGEVPPCSGIITTLANTLEELQNGGGVYTPSDLLKQVTKKCQQFAGGGQHDSHELLRRLLESVRNEDLRRYQLRILESLGMSSKTDPTKVEGELKQKTKFYGEQAFDRILCPDKVFRGFLVSTLMCQDCHHTSSRHEFFLDISLPVSVEKPQPPIRRKNSPENSPSSKYQQKKEKSKGKRNSKHVKKNKSNKTGSNSSSEQSDADIEDNLSEDTPSNLIKITNSTKLEKNDDVPENLNKDLNEQVKVDDDLQNENKNTVIELGISSSGSSHMKEVLQNPSVLANEFEILTIDSEKKKNRRKRLISHTDWSTTIAPRYQCEDGECSVQSCLNNFTASELMTGNNKVGCDSCTEKINGKNGKTINTNSTKQYFISNPPAVLILHLKRFQVGPRCMFRKLSTSVKFPLVLDIAPFCASKVKVLPNVNRRQKKLLYSLYGVVEHSGTMYGGHYVAYVKVRPQLNSNDNRWNYLPKGNKTELDQCDEQVAKLQAMADEAANDSDDSASSSNSQEGIASGYTDPDVQSPPGKWYYVSDSHVREISEEQVLKSEAYLLFYERIY